MFSTVFIFILAFLYFDGRIFRQRNEELYRQHFRLRKWMLPLWCVILLIFAFFPEGLESFSALFFVLILPTYMAHRHSFEKILRNRQTILTPATDVLPLISDTISVILFWFLGMIAVEVLVKIALENVIGELTKTLMVSIFSFGWVTYLVSRMVLRYPYISFKEILGLRRKDIPAWRLWILPALLGAGAAAISSYIIHTRPFQPITPLSDLLDSTQSAGVILFFLLLAVLMAPFFEEIIFRGFFFYVLRKFKGTAVAIVVIAALFGAMHFRQYWHDWAAILVVTALGFVLTGLRAWTGSSIPGMVTHYLYNFMMVMIPMVMLLASNPSYYEYQVRINKLNSTQKQELLLRSIDENPRHAASYNDLAWIYAEEGENLDEALHLINRALEIDPGRFQMLDTKAEILYKMGRIEEAVAIEEGLVERLPDNKYAREQLKKFRKGLKK